MIMDNLVLIGVALAGTLLSSFLSCIPALHIYNVAGFLVILALRFQGVVSGEILAMFMLGLVVGYAVLNTIPSIFLAAPDDSTIFLALPGQKYLMERRGFEASVLSGVGALGGLLVLLLVAVLMISSTITPMTAVLIPDTMENLKNHEKMSMRDTEVVTVRTTISLTSDAPKIKSPLNSTLSGNNPPQA